MDEHTVQYSMRIEGDSLVYTRESMREKRELVYNKDKCIGCWLCYDSCPTEAISRNPISTIEEGRVNHPDITIDPEECILCGVCAEVCMFGSLDLRMDGTSIGKGGYPRFQGEWVLDEEKCKPKDGRVCTDCEDTCPRDALKCSLDTKNMENRVEHDEELCIHCSTCQLTCPEEAIRVEKVFEGEISVDLETCQGCGVCVNICPSKALSMPKADIGESVDRLVVNQDVCIYCGACANSCPVEALDVKRTNLRYGKEKTRSGNKRRECIFQELITEK